jgi:hypothetical protein
VHVGRNATDDRLEDVQQTVAYSAPRGSVSRVTAREDVGTCTGGS